MEKIDSFSNSTLTAVPDLLKLLLDDDLVVAQQASILMVEMTQVKYLLDNLIQTDNTFSSIITCLNSTVDYFTIRNLLLTLFEISKNFKLGIPKIAKCGVLCSLIKILDAPFENVVSISLSTIHNCLLSQDKYSMDIIRQKTTFNYLLNIFKKSFNTNLMTIATDCLFIMTFKHQQSKDWIHEIDGIQIIISFFVSNLSISDKLECLILKLILSLSANQNSKILMTDYAFLHRINELISFGNKNRLICISLIKNLSDQLTLISYNSQLVANFYSLFKQSSLSLNIKSDILLILLNLSCNNEKNKEILIDMNSIEVLMKNLEIDELALPSLWLLKNLAIGNPKSLFVQDKIKNYGLESFRKLMTNPKYTKAVLILIKILTKTKNFDAEIRNCGLLSNMLLLVSNILVDIECISLCAQSLINLIKDPNNLVIIKRSIHLFEQMKNSNNNQIQKIGLDLYNSAFRKETF